MAVDTGAHEAPRSPITSFFRGLGAIVVVMGAIGWVLQDQLMESRDILKVPYDGGMLTKYETEALTVVTTAAGFVVYVLLGRGRV